MTVQQIFMMRHADFPMGYRRATGRGVYCRTYANLSKTDRILLEIGIGTGRIALPLAPLMSEFVAGADISH